jgi:peptide/nickel transport system substrate-binding protein
VSSFGLAFRSDAQYNETNWRDPAFDQLLTDAATATDPSVAADLYRQAQTRIMREGGQIVPVFASLVAAMREGCTGYVPHVESRVMFQDITCD